MMVADEARRLALYDALRRTFDDDDADTLMEMLPPRDWGDVATTALVRSQGDQLRQEMATQGDQLRQEMATQGAQLRQEMATQGAQLRQEVADLRADLHGAMAANQRQLMFGLFGAVAANAGVVWAALSAAG